MSTDDDLSHLSLLELFREEAQTQTRVLSDGLLALEHRPTDASELEACMRAAHSLKGAARIIGLQVGVNIAHVMEECFVAAQRGALTLSTAHIDELLRGVDLLLRAGEPDPSAALKPEEVNAFVTRLAAFSTPDVETQSHADFSLPSSWDNGSVLTETDDADAGTTAQASKVAEHLNPSRGFHGSRRR